MLPDILKSKYQQYKNDTDVVATWLANTSKSFGYESLETGAKNPSATSGRLKGKARKQMKQQQAQQASSATSKETPSKFKTPNESKHVLKIKDFVPMAEHIAITAQVPFRIPTFVSIALQRVIEARKAVARTLASSQSRNANITHAFFVNVLENVRQALEPFLEPDNFSLDKLKTSLPEVENLKKDDTKSPANIFAFLDVYEPSEEFLNAPAVEYSRSVEAQYTAETENSSEEAAFALVSLLADLDALRDELRDMWARYAADEIDLAAVSVATSTAIELARSMEEEVNPILDKSGGAGVLLQTFVLSACKALGHDWQMKQRTEDDFGYACYDIGNKFFFNTQFFIHGFVKANPSKTLPQYNGTYGWYNEDPKYQPTSNRQKWTQDKTALAEMLADLLYFADFFQQPVEDELVRGMKMIRETDIIPIWFNFAAQIYLDVLESERTLGVGRSFAQMQLTSLFIKKSLSKVPSSSKERQKALRLATMWEHDPVTKCREMLYAEKLQKPLPPKFKRPLFNFLRRHPLYCGLWVHRMRTEFHRQGVLYSAFPGAVMCVGQLYHALCQEELLPVGLVWDDMKTLRNMQGDDAFFVGNPPTCSAEYFKNFCLTIGMSITNWASNKRDKRIKTTQATRREMHFKGWASMTMEGRINPYTSRGGASSEVVSEIIKAGWQSQKHHLQTGQDGDQSVTGDKDKRNSPVVPPTELVQQLAKTVHAEIHDLKFDYFAMHDICWSFLEDFRKCLEKRLGANAIAKFIPQEDKLPHLVGFVFSTAAGALDLDQKTEPDTTMFTEAAGLITDRLVTGGGHYCIEDAAGASLDVDEAVELDFGDLSADPWNIGSGRLIDFIEKGFAGGNCPMQ